MTTRIRYGLTANGKTGYHGYKWKEKEKVELYVWCFAGLTKIQIESIEARICFSLYSQKNRALAINTNEIHFNNEFDSGKVVAEKLFKWTR
ncbi:MAG: hypothetical protein IPN43_07740 [Chitinophagaceae bacterium]|nr:hypothetical protein [Chitinophagaceae bacterium]